jgi:hypothetical protein
VSPWWSIRTRDATLSRSLSRDGYWPWALRLGMLLLLDRDGYWQYDPWFFMLFQTMTDIAKFHKLWPKIYYSWLLGHATVMGITIFKGLWLELLFHHFFCNDGYCFIYVILCVLDNHPSFVKPFYQLQELRRSNSN